MKYRNLNRRIRTKIPAINVRFENSILKILFSLLTKTLYSASEIKKIGISKIA
jgi:hypothetical protein